VVKGSFSCRRRRLVFHHLRFHGRFEDRDPVNLTLAAQTFVAGKKEDLRYSDHAHPGGSSVPGSELT
jgi:hypothetical protein